MDTGRGRHISYKFPEVDLDSLLKMLEKSPSGNLEFYDPLLRCFTFPDYQLAPTLEDYSCILGIPIKLQVPFHVSMEVPDSKHITATLYLGKSVVDANLKTKGGLSRFHLSFLLETLGALTKEEKCKVFNIVLACSIYGIVLFPNVVDFVDMNFIRIFMTGNPVPTLLGDVHLLYKGAFVDTKETLMRSKRLMGLTSKDVVWYNLRLDRMEKSEVIMSCGEFPNMPLMGIKGGINYNLVLSQRQLGYALKGPPEDRSIQESLLYSVIDGVKIMKKVAKAWNHILCKGKEFFGKKDYIAYPLYIDWIKDRVQTLKQEKEELSMQVFGFRQEKMDLAHKLKERDELLGEYCLVVDRRIRKKPKDDMVRGSTSTVVEE
ncbi:uncharacterized protein LOC127096265 [Lathyrus oleraceus]|uniref:uncharacterized protein LOC127096265 n=1 Tax=Pisum sativum TaxID=3888 RepID=UPI0021CF8049|nr:uncharacterized protein LOC127096265 [Pisum sativum]